ncbi:MAG: hypothetical protein ACRDL7_03185 [Gaiellaceae bacterium]
MQQETIISMSGIITRSQGEAISTSLFKDVYLIHPDLNVPGVDHSKNALWLCMDQMQCSSILDLLELSDDDIDDLDYTNDNNVTLKLPLKYKKTIKYTIWWRNIKASESQDQTTVNWSQLTTTSFSQFRQDVVPLLQTNIKMKEPTMSTTPSASAVERFNSGIKRDTGIFPTFSGKNDEWYLFDRDLHAIAKVQQIERILLDSPPVFGSVDCSLWDAQNAFLYSVFMTKLTKGQAVIFVREEYATGDAHAVYAKMHHHYNADSNRLAIQVQYETKLSKLLLEYNYPGGPSKFLGDFQQCILDLEAAKQQPLSDSDKKSKLCSAIRDSQYIMIREIIASDPATTYAQAITKLEHHIMMQIPQKLSRRMQQAQKRDQRGGGRSGCGRRGGRLRDCGGNGWGVNSVQSNDWIDDEQWKQLSKAEQMQRITD